MESASSAVEEEPVASRRLVLKNTLYLGIAQALTIPISVVVNGLMARYLGAEVFGHIYFATTLTGFGFLGVEWGHHGVLPALVAQNHSRGGPLLGSSLVWRAAAGCLVYLLLAGACWALGYEVVLQQALAFVFLGALVNSFLNAGKDTMRGFERTDVPSIAQVAQQFAVAILVAPVLMLGGGMQAALLAQVAAAALLLLPVARALAKIGVGKLSISRSDIGVLFKGGTPFVFFGLALALQPNIDALYLSKLAPTEVMGWHGAARRLIGVLLFPASALVGALYPTLCRLHVSQPNEFLRTTNAALRGACLPVVPVALGCALYPDIGIAIFSREAFGPAEDNLRILALFLFLVYFSMPLGTALLAAGRQRAWTVVQAVCVVVSLVLDPVLVRYTQDRFGNGGIGLCVAAVVSELVVVVAGLWMIPRGVLDRLLLKSLGQSALAGGAMAGIAMATRSISPFISAPLAVVGYGVVLFATGAVDRERLAGLRGLISRKS